MKNIALILASGSGSRMGLDIPKQFFKLKDKTVLEYSVSAFQEHKDIDEIIIVTNPDYLDLTSDIINKNTYSKVSKIISGGITRQESSYIGVFSIEGYNHNVLIHDAARPFISQKVISDCIQALKTYSAVNTVADVTDTIIEVDDNNYVSKAHDRKKLRRCQTPQAFNVDLIKKAHLLARQNNYTATDDCSLILKYNLCKIYCVFGSEDNIKITYPSDIN